MGAEKVGSFADARKVSGPFPVDACLPIPVNVAVTFTAEPVTFSKVDELSVIKSEFVSIFCIVAVEAPPHRLRMMELDVRMFVFELPLLRLTSRRRDSCCRGDIPSVIGGEGQQETLLLPWQRR